MKANRKIRIKSRMVHCLKVPVLKLSFFSQINFQNTTNRALFHDFSLLKKYPCQDYVGICLGIMSHHFEGGGCQYQYHTIRLFHIHMCVLYRTIPPNIIFYANNRFILLCDMQLNGFYCRLITN